VTARAARALAAVLLAGALAAACAAGGKPSPAKEAAGKPALPVRGLAKDETWSGEVRIRGSVVVPRGVTLTVEPGTVVRFEKIDVDGDGIGDSELYVEGSLLAEGAPGRPIVFTSAEKEPAPRDWKYLFVNLSARTVMRHCVSEYAFSGVQIHFSRATVSRCLFRNCVDGLRFSTAEGVFSRNRMTGNVYGVRYEERGSTAVLERNDIAGNKVGIFCVMESKGKVTIRENRIHGNADYEFKLGNRQKADVPAPGNWWGASDAAAIRARIFDKGAEPELGTVLFEPFLAEPPAEGEGYGT
jgi:hypothetical protein